MKHTAQQIDEMIDEAVFDWHDAQRDAAIRAYVRRTVGREDIERARRQILVGQQDSLFRDTACAIFMPAARAA